MTCVLAMGGIPRAIGRGDGMKGMASGPWGIPAIFPLGFIWR